MRSLALSRTLWKKTQWVRSDPNSRVQIGLANDYCKFFGNCAWQYMGVLFPSGLLAASPQQERAEARTESFAQPVST